jgi:hypothetical protein
MYSSGNRNNISGTSNMSQDNGMSGSSFDLLRYNLNTNHPIIENSQEYMFDRQIISIHSEDRNILKFPNSSAFTIELPQEYNNVLSITLESWTFPSNYNTFSVSQNNISLAFQITNIYNYKTDPNNTPNPTNMNNLNLIYQALAYQESIGTIYYAIIEEGFYNPIQMATELQNRMNATIDNVIIQYIEDNSPASLPYYLENSGYNQFVVVYNQVSQKLYFGNKSSGFSIINDDSSYGRSNHSIVRDCQSQKISEDVYWGLPYFLGFTRCPINSTASVNGEYPRFYYGDAIQTGDGGYWLRPDPSWGNSIVYYLMPIYKINLMGQPYFYMEIEGMNNIDETSPFSISNATVQSNETIGVVKSSFAKISVPVTPVAQWFETISSKSIKKYNPPAERIRRLSVKLRYHDGSLVEFGTFNYSFSLELIMLRPQQNKALKVMNPYIGQV